MIIKEIYINNFGKFNNFNIRFNRGFNLIYGENEAGKTTILNFILMMLYGNNSKSTDINQNERRKYKPWNNEPMRGSLIIEKDMVEYKIERTFNASNTTDIVEIYNLHTGKKFDIPSPKEPGKFFFRMGYESFKKTLFISSEAMVIDDKNDKGELTKKLVNLVTTGEENLSYKKVQNNIDKKIESYASKSGHKGLLVDANDKLDNLYLEFEEGKLDEKDKSSLLSKVNFLTKNEESIQSEIDEFREALDLKAEKERLIDTKRDFESKKNRLESQIKDEEIERMKIEFDLAYKRYNFEVLPIFLSFIFFVCGILINQLFYLVSILFLLFSIFKYFRNRIKNEKIKENIKKNLEIFEKKRAKNQSELELINEEIKYITKAEQEIDYQLNELGYKSLELDYNRLENLNKKKSEINSEIVQIKSTSKERFRGKRNISTILSDIELTKKEIRKLEKELSLLLKTKEYIKKSFDEVEVDFSGKINEKASKIIQKITNGKYDRLYIANDFSISILDSKTRNIKEWKYLSSGTIDQLYLSLRLAITELIIEHSSERILLLDDIFIRYDNNRAKESMDFLKDNLDNFSQIIAFTSHRFSTDNLDKINYINI
ncbi:ATP-binding protein [Helcococcus kunzii]|uniref:Rad50/SbcC-type AAA domain-containing protein n=1 Tax=Helcococcus kunzii ATCC 51366 TaxID=883114 RepID=H3NLY5_9FIRM|nr:AAA family ATPase [Helcococcus kunzii]EHR35655.1 hypothetical protein HMPREF9709_00346 [Helcococcus kunzii ATCC 51366]QUY64307.1 AAA family ATPase [Helcococcus kunzii]